MLIYFIFLLLVGVEAVFMKNKQKACAGESVVPAVESSLSKKFFILVCVELIFLAGLRASTVGADTSVYLRALDYYRSLDKFSVLGAPLVYPFDFEIGYFLFTKIAAFLGLSNTVFLFLVAIAIYIPLFAYLYRKSKMPYLSILIYFAFFFAYSLGVFRQMIALSIVLISWRYVEARKPIKFLLCILAAVLFHTTALIVLPLYWLKKINIKYLYYLFFPAELICLLFGRPLVIAIMKIFPKYAGYLNGQYGVASQGSRMLILMTAIVVATIPIVMKKEQKILDPTLVGAVMIGTLLQAMAYSFSLLGRVVVYYAIYLIILIPDLIIAWFGKKTRKLVACAVGLFFIVYFYLTLRGDTNIVPYRFFWQ